MIENEQEDVYIPPFRELFYTAKETDKAGDDSLPYPEPPPTADAEQRGTPFGPTTRSTAPLRQTTVRWD